MKKFLYDEIANRWLKGCDSIWVYSDTHFGDLESYKLRGIIDCITEEQFNMINDKPDFTYAEFLQCLVKQADEEQIKRINAKAGRNSCLIILGDVGDTECVKKLRAKRKILIMGNHDKGASNYKRFINEDVLTCPKCGSIEKVNCHYDFDNDNYIGFMHEEHIYKCKKCDYKESFRDAELRQEKRWFKTQDNHLFDEVYEGPVMINDRTILSHEPVFAGVPYFKNIHGHVHKADYKGDEHHLNCCAEAINYEPINLLSLFKKGFLKNIDSIHRMTIDTATARKRRK